MNKRIEFVIQFQLTPQLNIIGMMEQQTIKVQIYHDIIGSHTFEFSDNTHTSDLRLHILENSPLYIYQNFHFEFQGNRLLDFNQISEVFSGDVRLQVIFDPYDENLSRYHQMRVKDILVNPVHWTAVNSRDYSSKVIDEDREDFPALELHQIFQQPFFSKFLDVGEKKETDFANMINSSGFNPPPYYRKLLGDLHYLHIKTLEDVDFHVTANAQGFVTNQSSQGNFNPNPHPKYTPSISLLELIFQLSPKFKVRFQQLQKKIKITEFQRMSQGEKLMVSNNIWMTETKCWKKSNTWKNDCCQQTQRNDFSAIKDWIEIFQYQRTSSNDSLNEKIGKEKLRYRMYQEFIESVKEGVLRIFNGMIQPLNHTTKIQHRIYYYSSLLFYFVNDDLKKNEFLPSGSSVNKDILTRSLVEPLEIENVYLSHAALVNYRGYKIVGRTIPNSLINTSLETHSVRDILSGQNKAQSDDVIIAAIRKICKSLGVQSQNLIIDEKGCPKLICLSPDITACASNDNKKFILEMTAFLPRDLNFTNEHQQCFHRPQLLKIFNTRQKCSILYNPNIGTAYTLSNLEKYKQQQKKLQSVAKFAKEIMVSLLVDNFDGEMRKSLSDSHSIVQSLHKHGLSSKYLGLVCKKAEEKSAHHVKIMIERTILVRSLKTLFKKALKETSWFLHKTVIKHLLNCLFEEDVQNGDGTHKQIKTDDQLQLSTGGKKSKKKRVKQNETCFQMSFEKTVQKYCFIKKEDMWEETKQIALIKFKHVLGSKSSFFKFQFSNVAILRDLCLCLGIVLEKRDYFSYDNGGNFTQEHIVNLIPKVKIILSEPKELQNYIEEGQKFANKFQIQQAFEAYNKAFQYIFSSFGGIHEKLGLMYNKFAGLHHKIGDIDAAVLFALNSHQIYQNLYGIDHVETIDGLMMVGVYQFSRKRFAAAEFYMLKAIFLAKFSYSECYPEVMLMYMNLSTVYEAQRKYTDAIMSLFMALNISISVYGQIHLHTAIIFAALASLHYDIPDIEQTIKFQQKSIFILQKLLGDDDERVIQAKNTCEGYKNIQNSKKVREVHEKQQRNPFGLPPYNKFNLKAPFCDMRERASDFAWKKPRKFKYFF